MNNNQQPENKLYQIGAIIQSIGCIGCMLPLVIFFSAIFLFGIWEMMTAFF
ncbi:hypothetical protein [Lentilactobacillus fungorum]|uniref:hypothetical protein n=1 Tax=Lentilactobacillus fungorum TaxID=2201250 RepID=UPI001943CE4F|nr:hypothetical protein [Lentilactobacillus fungorum]